MEHNLGLHPNFIGINHRNSVTISCVLMRTLWKCLVIMHRDMFGKNKTQHIATRTSYRPSSLVVTRWWFGHVLQLQDMGNWDNDELHFILDRFFRQIWGHLSNSLRAKFGHGSGLWSQAPHQQTSEWLRTLMVKKSPELIPIDMLWWDLRRTVPNWNTSDVSELKQCCKEQVLRYFLKKKKKNNYRKYLFKFILVEGGAMCYWIIGCLTLTLLFECWFALWEK